MIKNDELSEEDVRLFYQENMKIGIPIVHDRGTDIIVENDFYYYNSVFKSDKLHEFARGMQNITRLNTKPSQKWKHL